MYLRKIQILSSFIILPITFIYTQPTSYISNFKFETQYFNAINEWVVFPMSKLDSSYAYGYIFFDEEDGFMFLSGWELKVKGDSIIYDERKREKAFSTTFLNQYCDLVSILNPKQLKALNLENGIDWLDLSFYKTRYENKKDSLQFIVNVGRHLYEAEAYLKTIEYFEKAYKIKPHLDYIEYQLSYSYYKIKQYKKAIKILKKALLHDPLNFYFYKTLGLCFKELNQIRRAKNIFENGYKNVEDNFIKSSIALELVKLYPLNKDKEKFDFWSNQIKKLNYSEHIISLEILKNQRGNSNL